MRASLCTPVLATFLLVTGARAPSPANDGTPSAVLVSRHVTVKEGDTLSRIASRNGVKLADLRRWNRGRIGANDVIQVGAKLVIKLPADAVETTPEPTTEVEQPDRVRPPLIAERWEDHVRVRRGDTLSKIAKRFDVTVDELRAWNRLGRRSRLRAGQTLKVERDGPRPTPQSVGRPTSGSLSYGRHLGKGVGYRLRFPKNAYGVDGVLATLKRCARRVHERFDGTHDILIGDISRPGGGRFRPHESHQNGRDVDVGYYLASNEQNKTMYRVRPEQVDLAKTWAHLRCHITTDSVVRVYMDKRIQHAMVDWLRDVEKVSQRQLERLFSVEGDDDALIRHAKKHDTHFHVRFACDRGQPECSEEADDAPFIY